MQSVVEQNGLNVFDSNTGGLDFNTSSHFPQGIICISFLTDDLIEIENRLKSISYEGPKPSHLGMTCIEIKDP